jgi:uncharacterized protein YbjQ (UPF0145 family)
MAHIRIATTEGIAGEEIVEVLGVVEGSTIQTRHIGSHILAGLMTIVGGEVKGYVQAVNAARAQALERMLAKAEGLGADAVVCVRYSTSQIMDGGAEILVYGTAVKLKR